MYNSVFAQFKKMLGQLSTWLDLAEADATARKYDAVVLLGTRLTPNQFALLRQIQIACDTAKLGAARLAGVEAPKHDDSEVTIADLRTRIASTQAFLTGLAPTAFAEAGSRVITQPRWEGKVMSGDDYLHEHVIPNFYFHLGHAYALLRHAGVNVGKRDYLGPLTQRPG